MRVKLLLLVLIILPLFLFTVSVGAETTSVAGTTDSASTTRKPLPLIQEKREMIIKNRQETRTILKDKREELKDKKVEFREKLQIIRDEKKRSMVEGIDEKISRMNSTHTARFSTVLEKLEMVLNKITEKAQIAKSKGVDSSMVDSAIVAAKTAIDAAKATVTAQGLKTYSIEVVSETALKRNVGSVVSMFRKDLKDVHKAVVDAKQAVQKAEMELAKVRGEQKEVGDK